MLLRAVMILICAAGAVPAQQVALAVDPDIAGVLDASPKAMVKKLRSGPDAFMRNAARIIYGYGVDGGIDAAGIEAYVALERADTRARQTAVYLAADLNDDSAVSQRELMVLVASKAAGARGRLQFGFVRADTDGDGSLTMAELRTYSAAAAVAEFSEEDALNLRGLLRFDLDGDGTTSMTEVGTVVGAILADT